MDLKLFAYRGRSIFTLYIPSKPAIQHDFITVNQQLFAYGFWLFSHNIFFLSPLSMEPKDAFMYIALYVKELREKARDHL